MRRTSQTYTLAADAALTIAASTFPNVGLLQVMVVLTSTATAETSVTVQVKRGALDAITIGTIAIGGAKTGYVAYTSPIVLTGNDALIISSVATGSGGTAIVNVEAP